MYIVIDSMQGLCELLSKVGVPRNHGGRTWRPVGTLVMSLVCSIVGALAH